MRGNGWIDRLLMALRRSLSGKRRAYGTSVLDTSGKVPLDLLVRTEAGNVVRSTRALSSSAISLTV